MSRNKLSNKHCSACWGLKRIDFANDLLAHAGLESCEKLSHRYTCKIVTLQVKTCSDLYFPLKSATSFTSLVYVFINCLWNRTLRASLNNVNPRWVATHLIGSSCQYIVYAFMRKINLLFLAFCTAPIHLIVRFFSAQRANVGGV